MKSPSSIKVSASDVPVFLNAATGKDKSCEANLKNVHDARSFGKINSESLGKCITGAAGAQTAEETKNYKESRQNQAEKYSVYIISAIATLYAATTRRGPVNMIISITLIAVGSLMVWSAVVRRKLYKETNQLYVAPDAAITHTVNLANADENCGGNAIRVVDASLVKTGEIVLANLTSDHNEVRCIVTEATKCAEATRATKILHKPSLLSALTLPALSPPFRVEVVKTGLELSPTTTDDPFRHTLPFPKSLEAKPILCGTTLFEPVAAPGNLIRKGYNCVLVQIRKSDATHISYREFVWRARALRPPKWEVESEWTAVDTAISTSTASLLERAEALVGASTGGSSVVEVLPATKPEPDGSRVTMALNKVKENFSLSYALGASVVVMGFISLFSSMSEPVRRHRRKRRRRYDD